MALSTIDRVSPFSSKFNWDSYTNELYFFSDDYGFLTIDQMKEEIQRFQMYDYTNRINTSMTVDDFVDFLFDAAPKHD
jgi:hypothetical protein